MTDIEIGSTCNGFVLQRRETIPEIDSTVYLFTHARLGTPALAIKNSDPNKTFCLAFQTVPEDSTGVAHILEHSVLMGSHKYPVKDVFGEINKGGLMTFLNAMTGSDTTWYPFATRNLKEYFNIMDVYCDVTLHPLLLRTTFEQEGWHYHKEAEDQPLQYRGVVLNEMKGAFSDPIRAIFHNMFKGLLPGSTYAHESGGDPRNIPDLSYEQFVDFHRRHYHPANATIFFYGDAKLEDELAFVQNHFLRHFTTTGGKARIVQGRDTTGPVVIEDTYGIQPGSAIDGKTFLAVGSTVGTVVDRRRNAAFQVIANILYNSDASPLKNAIIDAGLGKDFGGLFLTDSCFKTIIMTYLIGSDPDSLESFRKIYQHTLAAMVAAGLDHDLVLSELNKYEFSVREEMIKAQRGLDLISKALPAIKYEIDPFEALRMEELFKDIRAKALDDNYFEQLIEKYLLANPATVEIILRPDPQKMIQTQEEEQRRLAAFERQLDDQGRKELIRRTRELMELQQRPNDEKTLSLLPRLKLADLQRRIDFHQVQVEELKGRQFLINDLPTNSVSYIDFGLDCSGLTAELLPYLNLFGTIVTEIGTSARDYMQFATALGIYTGGFTHSFNTYTHMAARETCRPVLWLHLKALSSYLERALLLVGEVFSDVSFRNRQHIKEIVLREFAWAEHSVQSEGYGLASCRVFSHLSQAAKYNEYVNGATAYQVLKNLAQNYDRLEEHFLGALRELRRLLFRRSGLTLGMTASRRDIDSFKNNGPAVIDSLNDAEVEPVTPQFQNFPQNQGFCTSAEVVFNVQGCHLFADPDSYNGHFEVLKTWISRDYLWNSVRQEGGAYGCFIQFNQITGNLALVSYRDPQIDKTFAAYNDLGRRIAGLDLSDKVMEQLIIGTYGGFDPHQGPAAKGATARNEYLSGITPEFKQKQLDDILDSTITDMRRFAPLFDALRDRGYRATIGNGEKIRAAKDLFNDITDI